MSDMAMTVGQLKAALTHYSDDTLVVMSKDGEGNEYSPLSEDSEGRYRAENTYSGEMVHPDDYEESDDLPLVCCLWPVN
jgi:hypothetical protein